VLRLGVYEPQDEPQCASRRMLLGQRRSLWLQTITQLDVWYIPEEIGGGMLDYRAVAVSGKVLGRHLPPGFVCNCVFCITK